MNKNFDVLDLFDSKGGVITPAGKEKYIRVVEDNRKPFYIVFILDDSGSMAGESTYINERGETVRVMKITQLNDAVKKVIKTLQDFERANPLYRVFVQFIELNSYGKAVFPEFMPIARVLEVINFEADGCTELRASLNTLKTFISAKYLRDDRPEREGKGYNKAVSVILMSDGWPTDSNGLEQSGPAYRNVIDEFKRYLVEMDYARSVDLYSMAVGDDACEDMLRYFCDGDEDLGENSRYYRVEESESIASALDYLTRATLAHHTTTPIDNDFDDDDDEEDEVYDNEVVEEDFDEDEVEEVEEKQIKKVEPVEVIEDDNNVKQDNTVSTGGLTKYQIDIIKCKKDKCKACLADKCPLDAIEVHSGIISINQDKCNGCGLCETECPYSAIQEIETDEMLDNIFDGIE